MRLTRATFSNGHVPRKGTSHVTTGPLVPLKVSDYGTVRQRRRLHKPERTLTLKCLLHTKAVGPRPSKLIDVTSVTIETAASCLTSGHGMCVILTGKYVGPNMPLTRASLIYSGAVPAGWASILFRVRAFNFKLYSAQLTSTLSGFMKKLSNY